MTENDYVLYVIVRTNLDSMNPGKAQAHSGHAACAFMYRQYNPHAKEIIQGFSEWVKSTPQGFGTQFNLKANDWFMDIINLELFANEHGYPFDRIIDPTYPFEVSEEVLHLLSPEFKENAVKKGNKYLCFREEETAAYIFGRKSDLKLQQALKPFKRHP
jgi:peptidyl-tRNA hydrolase